jgi:catechol 2,3-dioxygenase
LEDAEGNTVELYVATPEEGTWDSNDEEFIVYDRHGNRKTGIDTLDVGHLMSYLAPEDDLDQPMPKGTITGHVHLYMNNLQTAMHFYSDVLGFYRKSLVSKFRMGETILPGYDVHIIAFNDWKGKHAKATSMPATGLNYFTINLKKKEDLEMIIQNLDQENIIYERNERDLWVSDPADNKIRISVEENQVIKK